jgi:ADP-heptose:LPS heptosyltransferase
VTDAARAGNVGGDGWPPRVALAAAAGHGRRSIRLVGYTSAMDRDDARHQDEAGLGPDPVDVGHVLAVRPGGVAEVVRAVPALRHLRSTYPEARISVAAHAPARELLQACPYVDRVIALEQPSEALLEQFDVALSWARPDDQVLKVEEVRARFRASWRDQGEPQRRAIHPTWPVRMDAAARMFRLAWLLGGELGSERMLGLWPRLADRNGAARLVSEAMRPIALVHVGAGQAERRWPPGRWAEVVDLLDAAGLDPVLVGTEGDRAAVDATRALVRHAPIDVVGRTSVGELCGLLERAALFVGGDSAPAAMASALDVRSVVVAPASAYEYESRPGRFELVGAGPCSECGDHACSHPAAAARQVPLERALGRIELAAAAAVERWHRARIA